MSWPQWPLAGPAAAANPPLPTMMNPAMPVVNSAPPVLPAMQAGSQYSPDQWAHMQQNWQQWAQWQQQYQQWHQQYGAEYQKTLNAMNTGYTTQPMPNMGVPPPPPVESKPPPPPSDPPMDSVKHGGYSTAPPGYPLAPPLPAMGAYQNYGAPPPAQAVIPPAPVATPVSQPAPPQNWQQTSKANVNVGKQGNQQGQGDGMWNQPPPPVPKPNTEELSEAEKKFDKQFAEWEAQFNKWKDQNANHPDKEQYREYEKKWENWRNQLLDRREQMRRKRLGLAPTTPKPTAAPSTVPPTATTNQFAQREMAGNFSQPPPALQQNAPQDTARSGGQNHPKTNDNKTSFMTHLPPNLNNEPLTFKQSVSNIVEETSTDKDGEDFLKTTSGESGGIPGLDLVDDSNENDHEENRSEVIDLEKDSNTNKRTGPDLEAISKGINTILGDKNLLNMLSKVSQQTNVVPATSSTFASTASRMDSFNNPGASGGIFPIGGQHTLSNDDRPTSQGDFQRDFVNNFDDQTRSSFTAGGPEQDGGAKQGNFGQFDRSGPFSNKSGPQFGQYGNNQFGGFNNQFGQLQGNRSGGPPSGGQDNQFGPHQSNRQGGPPMNRDNQFGPPQNNRQGGPPMNQNNQFGPPHNNRQGGPPMNQDNQFGPPHNNRQGGPPMNQDNQFGPPHNNRQGGPPMNQDNQFGPPHNNRQGGPPMNEDTQFGGGNKQLDRRFGNSGAPQRIQPENRFNQGGPGQFGGPNRNQDSRFGNFNQNREENLAENDNRNDDFFENNYRNQHNKPDFNNSQNRNEFNNRNFGNRNNFEGSFNNRNRNEFDNNMNNSRDPNDDYDGYNDEGSYHEEGSFNDDFARDNFSGQNFNNGRDNFRSNRQGGFHDEDRFNRGGTGFNKRNNDFADGPSGPKVRRTNSMSEVGDARHMDNFENDRDRWNEYDDRQGGFNEGRGHFNDDDLNAPRVPSLLSKVIDKPVMEAPKIVEKVLPPPEDDVLIIANVIDYEHKSQKQPADDFDVLVEPMQMYDYRHKPLNRIPYSQRPIWLHDTVRNIMQFEPVVSHPHSVSSRYERLDTWKADDYRSNRFDDYSDRRPLTRHQSSYDDFLHGDRIVTRPRNDNDEPRGERETDWGSRAWEDRDSRERERDNIRRDRYERSSYSRRTDRDDRRERSRSKGKEGKDDDSRGRDRNNRDERDRKDDRPRSDDRRNSDLQKDKADERARERDWEEISDDGQQIENKSAVLDPPKTAYSNTTLIQDILCAPGRFNRPSRIVIILRGPPGSGKTFLAKLIKDKEVENGGSAPRILCLDDYFMVEQEKEVVEDGKKIKLKEMVYEYEAAMEESYRNSLMKAFRKTVTDGFFSFIIVDNVNDKVKHFGEMWSFAKQNGFQVYICQLDLDVQVCTKRNIHNRSEEDIKSCVEGWEPTPSHHPILDATVLVQSGAITEVEMEEVNPNPETNDEASLVEDEVQQSKWDNFDCSNDNLAKLDGVSKPIRAGSRTMEEYLQLDDWAFAKPNKPSKPGQKRVRWADLEECKEQEKMRAIGFVVGHTNWDRMMDPAKGSSALTQTRYIE